MSIQSVRQTQTILEYFTVTSLNLIVTSNKSKAQTSMFLHKDI